MDNNEISHKKSKKKKHIDNDVEEMEVVNYEQQPKKKKKVKKEVYEEEEIESPKRAKKISEEDAQSIPKTIKQDEPEGDTWTKEDYAELIRRMEMQIPKNDTISFTSRIDKLDWEKIPFGNHTGDECFEQWKLIRTKVRHYRLLSEILHDAKKWVETPWAMPSSKKKTRHPEQPPRPLSSFMLYYMERKNKFIRRNPDLKLTEISRLIGENYKLLPPEKKALYIEKAKAMQEEYKENLSKFYQKYPELMRVTKKASKSNKPLPPVKLYIKDRLEKHQNDEDFNVHDYTEKYKEAWKNLSAKKKAYWIRVAKEEEEKYLEHLHEEELHDGESKPSTSYKSVISKEENAILDRLAGKPEKPPNSAYSLFSRLMLQDKDKNHLINGEPKNRMREIAKMWREVPEEKKKAYAEKVQHMLENYKLEFANYLESLPEDKRAEELARLQPKKKPAKLKQKAPKKENTFSDSKQNLFKNEPEMPPVTAWDLFKNEFSKKNSQLSSKVAFKRAAGIWKNLSKKEIEKYKKKHEALKAKYMVDFEAFLKTLNEDELKEYSALKNARSGEDDLNEDSLDEESSSEEEANSSDDSNDTSEESDSGVSEDSD